MFTQIDLELIAEALNARIETGMFDRADRPGEIVFGSESHCTALNELADKVVGLQEAEQEPFGHCDSCGQICDGSGECACGGPIAIEM